MKRKQTGIIGENEATCFLEKEGCVIIKRNFRTRRGEIDIIAVQNNIVIFIEVKTTRVYSEDSLEYLIHNRKRNKIIMTSKYFMVEHPEYEEYNKRYDVIFISLYDRKIIHIKNAFGLNLL
ncbi:MAG: YraN family protein [Spirochaetales bacterium]|nr:YraN family protein [Spirochaetales bacterium]